MIDNLPRVLPSDCDAVIDRSSWKVPRLFEIIREGGKVDADEMYQVFNMGIGMVVIVREKDASSVVKSLKGRVVGKIGAGSGVVRLA